MRYPPVFKMFSLSVVFLALLSVATPAMAAATSGSTSSPIDFTAPLMGLGIVVTMKELLEKRSTAIDEVKAIEEKAKTENRDLDEGEIKRCDDLLSEAEGYTADIDKRNKDAARDQRMQKLLDRMGNDPTPGNNTDPQAPVHPDARSFSVLRAINLRSSGKELDGLEAEVSAEIAKRSGKDPQGFYVPFDLTLEQRDLDTTAGAGSVATVTAPTLIEALRNRVLVSRLGATMLPGMQGDFELPKQTGTGTGYWVTEGNSPTESNQTIGQVSFSPSTLGAFTQYTRRFVKQTSIGAEMIVRNDLARVLTIELDRAAFNGSGSGAEPEGILQNSSVTTVALGTNGAAPTWAAMVDMETEVAAANADLGSLHYVTTAEGRGTLKTTEKAGSTARFIWSDDQTLNGYAAHATNQLPSNLTKGSGTNLSSAIFGDFTSVHIAMWSGIDILIDPFSQSTSGSVRVVMLQDVDIQLRHTESFSKIVDMVTT